MNIHIRLILAIGLVLLVAAAFGLTRAASRAIPRPSPSASAPAGYTVSRITYTLDPANPSQIAKVGFALNPNPDTAGTTVRAKLIGASATYAACARNAAGAWECPFGAVAVAAIDRLTVDVGRSAEPGRLRVFLPIVRSGRSGQMRIYLPIAHL